MTDRVRLSSEAQTELAEAIRWCEEQRPGLGGELLAAVRHTLSLIARRPELGGSVLVVAAAHLKRRPGYWKSRT